MLRQLEESYNCGGICYKPLHYITKSISEGPVTQTCEQAVVEEYSGRIGEALGMAVFSLLLILSAVGSVTLLCDFSKKK